MEAPKPPETVVPIPASCQPSRPGPVRVGEGVFQPELSGKYFPLSTYASPDVPSTYSTVTSVCSNTNDEIETETANTASTTSSIQTNYTSTPRRPLYSIMEAPDPPDMVQFASRINLVSCHQSLGPVVGSGEGVFQTVNTGKYSSLTTCSLPDDHSLSSAPDYQRCVTSFDDCGGSSGTPSRHRFLSVYYQNVRGLRTKTSDLKLGLSSCDYDVVVLTETWLRPDIIDAELTSDYSLFRCDRSESTSNLSRGGGVLVAVKLSLHCTEVSLTDCRQLEQVAVCVKLPNRSLHIFGIYLRPNSDPALYSTHSSAVQYVADRSAASDIVLLLGDYNLPQLQWTFDEDVNGYLPANASSEQELVLTESISTCGLVQLNSISNPNGRLLDLAFTNAPDDFEISHPVLPLLPIDPHHPPLELQVDVHRCVHVPANAQSDSIDLDLRRCDFESLNAEFSSVDWEQLLQGHSVDDIVLLFYDKLYEILHLKVSRRRPAISGANRKPWWSIELRNLRNRLRKARKRFFANKTIENRESLHLVELSYKELVASSYHEYMQRLQSNLKQNPSMFWRFVKQQRASNRVPDNVKYGDALACSSEEAANLFSTFFQSVFNAESPQPHPGCFQNVPSHDIHLPFFNFSREEVLRALAKLDASKGAGVDGLTPTLLKNCAESIVKPLTILFNRSLNEKTFPGLWKTAKMIPIHKSGSVRHVENYRGISILCCLGKLFESLVHEVLLSAAKPIISEYQHGFVPHRSATTNLLCYTNVLFREIESRNQVDSVYIDFSKAFDTVPHSYAVEKLRHMGFPDWIADWLMSYLTGRKAFVQVNSARSRTFYIPSGVPQGSVLGPLIFVLFINDLCLQISSGKLFFADDLKIFRVIKSVLDCVALQIDIDALSRWCKENGMCVNINKCKVITFSRCWIPINHLYNIDTAPLERVQSIRDLGVIMDCKLRFNEHISTVTAKAFSVLGFIRRNASQFTDVHTLKALFCALVRSILEYAAPIWAPYHTSQVIRIERVQKSFIRFALRHLPWNDPVHLPAYPERCQLIDLELLSARRLKLQRLVIFDIVQNNVDCSDLLLQVSLNVPQRQLRYSALIAVPAHRTCYGHNNPLSSCLRAFNNVSDLFDFNVSKNCFKNRIKNIA